MHFCLKVVSAGVCVVICVVVWIASSAHTESFVVMVFHLPNFQVRRPLEYLTAFLCLFLSTSNTHILKMLPKGVELEATRKCLTKTLGGVVPHPNVLLSEARRLFLK